jgi:hypothetical protein
VVIGFDTQDLLHRRRRHGDLLMGSTVQVQHEAPYGVVLLKTQWSGSC